MFGRRVLFFSSRRVLGRSALLARRLCVTTTVALCSACSDSATAPRDAPTGRAELQVADTPPILEDHTRPLPAVRRIGLEIEATGPFRPGTPIVIRARARANRTASATDIQLISLDDDASAIRGAETRGRVLERVAGAIAKGSERTITSSITFEREGYCRVRARAVGEPGAAELAKAPSDSVVLNLSTETLWIVVDEAGGRLTTGFDSTVATTPHQRPLFGSYGPFQAIAATGEQGAGSLSASGAVELSTTSGGYHYDGQVRYNDADVNAYRSVPDALINAVCHASGSPDVAVSTRTSQSGGFAFDCPAGYTTVTGNWVLAP